MSAVTITGSKDKKVSEETDSTIIQRKGNVTTFKQTKGLVAIDTLGDEFNVPDFTIKDILNAIPKECYKRDLIKSFSFVFRDIFFMILFGYLAATFIPKFENVYVRFALWTAYTVIESFPMVGLWILAHECGHQAFSDYGWVNDTVGWFLHSYCLNPYFSWKFSHRKHHKGTGHLRKDMAFVPRTKEEYKKKRNVVSLSELAEDSPISSLWTLFIQQIVGFQVYLLTDATGQPHPGFNQFYCSHLNPVSPIFDSGDYWFIVLSDIGILTQFYVVYQWIHNFGWFNCCVHWFIPYLLVNHWIVFLTYLQHTDVTLPHYEDNEWNFARGAAATIDREFGFVGWFFFHDIIETHVLHHYCSRIPFYNARIGTEAIKKVMGKTYAHTDESMFISLWKSLRYCQFVDGDNGVKMFRNHNGLGVKPTD